MAAKSLAPLKSRDQNALQPLENQSSLKPGTKGVFRDSPSHESSLGVGGKEDYSIEAMTVRSFGLIKSKKRHMVLLLRTEPGCLLVL